jgi:riboflavin biosynthesis pyrimidine reductase
VSGLRRLHPDPAETSPEEATTGLRLGELAPPDRPYLALNMIASADGAATIAGRTRALGDEVDRELFHGLRTQADCVMVGAGTAAIERYGRLVKDRGRRERRRAEGLAPDPLACVVSGDLSLRGDLPLLQDPESQVVVITASGGEVSGARATVDYLRAGGESAARPALAPLLGRLRSEHGVRSVVCEGGPTLNSSLLAEGLVDELFLTVAAKLVAGTPETTIVAGAQLPDPLSLELVSCHEAADAIYLRHRVRR